MLLGAVADDVTGGTDLASLLRREGLSVLQTFGVPSAPLPPADAVVVSCKTRTAPAAEAVNQMRAALTFLQDQEAERFYFKYCSTFDSTDEGNIGPAIEAGLEFLGTDFTVACPAYPALERTVYQGHLFVGEQLLSESHMRRHPLTPMTDSDLVRVLQRQCVRKVGLVALREIERGPEATRAQFLKLRDAGVAIAITDAIGDAHVGAAAAACEELRFVTGGAALAGALVRGLGRAELRPEDKGRAAPEGPVAVLSGSCSRATQEQVARAAEVLPSLSLDPLEMWEQADYLAGVVEWARTAAKRGSFLIYSTAAPQNVESIQTQLGRDRAASSIEAAFGTIARALADEGVRKFVVAGGETSGAVTDALSVRVMEFGHEIDPGVPWTYSIDPPGYLFALKSGNFGSPDFFTKAIGAVGERR